jgi:ABC-type Fe3+/spermidine/putrescine transport system ATPase subunit
VADFMGFRNIWEGKIEEFTENGAETKIVVNIGSSKLTSHTRFNGNSRSLKSALEETFKSKQAICTAIRPEDFLIGKGATNNLKCRADIVEYLGQISHVTGVLDNNHQADFRTSEKINSGVNLDLFIPPEKLLIFPKEGNPHV